MSKKDFNYKKAVEEIESIITRIENGEPDVDELAALVKRANELILKCQEKLRSASDLVNKTLDDMDEQ